MDFRVTLIRQTQFERMEKAGFWRQWICYPPVQLTKVDAKKVGQMMEECYVRAEGRIKIGHLCEFVKRLGGKEAPSFMRIGFGVKMVRVSDRESALEDEVEE